MNEPFAVQDQAIYLLVRQWVQDAFPWPAVVWPGRQYSWEEWQTLAQASA
ncbi:MAG: hypothetical protein HYZ45_08750 [Burkholderiales bacterium]|nr:hypothetical protein [Burkholderiales bacterium]